jgi:hypothetical protein
MRLRTLTILVAGIWLVTASPGWAREWKDNTGRFSVEAELVKVQEDSVLLKKADGVVIEVPLKRLGQADLGYLESLSEPDEPAPVEPAPDQPDQPDQPAAAGEPEAGPQKVPLPKELEQGSKVAVRAGALKAVLAQIQQSSGNPVRVVYNFGREDEQVLAKRVTVNLSDTPFWEAIDAICAASGLHFKSIKDGCVMLTTDEDMFGKLESVGDSVVVGPYQVRPCFGDFDDPAMVVRYEPRLGQPQVLGYHAELTLPGGNQVRYEPRSFMNLASVFTGELKLRLDPDVPQGTKKAERVDIEARLNIGLDWQPFTLPALGTFAPKPVKLGGGTILVLQAETIRQPPSDQEHFVVKTDREGVSLDSVKGVLIDEAGNRVEPINAGGNSGDKGLYTWNFDPAKITGDARKGRLALKMPDGSEESVGPLGEVSPKSVRAGAARIRLGKVGMKKDPGGEQMFEVSCSADGFALPLDKAVVIGPGGKPLEPKGGGGGGGSYGFFFDPSELPRDPLSCRLKVMAPTKTAEYVLRATLTDVPLVK